MNQLVSRTGRSPAAHGPTRRPDDILLSTRALVKSCPDIFA